MTELDVVRDAYLSLVACHTVTAELLRKSSKGHTFHGTVFQNKPLEEAKHLLAQAKAELEDWAIVGLVSTFERILFTHERSPLRSKPLRKRAEGLTMPSSHSRNLSRTARTRMWSVSVFIVTGLPMESAGIIRYTQIP